MKMNKITTRKQWTDEDNEAVCKLYYSMFDMQEHQHTFNKAKLFRELGEKLGRSKSSVECKCMNISAIFTTLLGFDYVKGLKPLNNYNHSLAKMVCADYGVEYVIK